MNKYIIGIDVKLGLSSAVDDIVQTDKGILMYLVPFPFHGCTQYDVQCHFADDSENHAVSILNYNTVSFNGTSKNDSNTTGLYADPGGRALEHSLPGIAGLSLVSVVCCQVEDSATGCSIVQRIATECVWMCVCVFVCVIECDQMQLKNSILTMSRKKMPDQKGRKSRKKCDCFLSGIRKILIDY
jgi:hypothetical protein